MNGQLVATLMAVMVALSACGHRADAPGQLGTAIAPFTQTRDQALRLVGSAKTSLGAEDLNSLTVAYTALEEKGNAYAGFLVSAIDDASFSAQKNAAYAAGLKAAIKNFNATFKSIAPSDLASVSVDSGWVGTFASSVDNYWNRYHAALPDLSAQGKLALVKRLQAQTVWPNYEDVATVETIARP